MAMYKLTHGDTVERLHDDGSKDCIPIHPENPEYQRYLADVAAGADVLPVEPEPEPVPDPDDETRSAYLQMAEEEGPDSAVQILIELYRFDRGLS